MSDLDPLVLLADFAALFANPAKAAQAIRQFQEAKAAAAHAEAGLAAARAAHDEYVRSTSAELDELRTLQQAMREHMRSSLQALLVTVLDEGSDEMPMLDWTDEQWEAIRPKKK